MTLREIANHPYFQISGYLIGVIGVLLAVYFYQKGKAKKQLAYFANDLTLIGRRFKNVTKLAVYYENNQVNDLTVSEVYIYNSGNVMLDCNDMVPVSPIRLKCAAGGQILEHQIEFASDESNNWRSELSNNEITIHFDYVRPLGGCKVKVAHTSDKLVFSGKLKESEIVYQRIYNIYKVKEQRKSFFISLSLTLTTILLGIVFSHVWFALSVFLGLITLAIIRQWRISIKMNNKNSIFNQFGA